MSKRKSPQGINQVQVPIDGTDMHYVRTLFDDGHSETVKCISCGKPMEHRNNRGCHKCSQKHEKGRSGVDRSDYEARTRQPSEVERLNEGFRLLSLSESEL